MEMIKNRKYLRLFIWSTRIILALVAIVILLASFYINSEPVQEKIKGKIAQETRNVVKVERVGLSLFPRPGIAFYQVNISIAEVTSIYLESAKIYPQILPLFIGKVRIAKVKFEDPDIIMDILDKTKKSTIKVKASSSAEIIEKTISIVSSVRSVAPDLVVVVDDGKLLLRNNNDVTAVRRIYALIALLPKGLEIKVKGDVDKWGEVSLLGNLHVEKNDIPVNGLSLSLVTLNNFKASVFDSSFLASVIISKTAKAINSIDTTMSGKIGPETVLWASKMFSLSPEQTLRAPISISNAHVAWQTGEKLAITAKAAIDDGPTISVVLNKNATDLALSELKIYDKESRANIALKYTKNIIDFSFKGNLSEKTLNRMFQKDLFRRGWIKGDFRTHLQLDQYLKSTATGHLEGVDFIIPMPTNVPIKVRRAIISADNKTLKVESVALSWGENNFDLKGKVKAGQDGLRLDMDVSSDAINVETIKKNFAGTEKLQEAKPSEKNYKKPALRGIIRFNAPSLTWGSYTANNLRGNIMLDDKGINANITEAFICGISIPGNLTFAENDIQLDFKPVAAGTQLESTLTCLFDKDSRITGILNFKAAVNSRGKYNELLSSLQGGVEYLSKDGIIYRLPLLAKIFSFLNLTELLRGKLPDFRTEGFEYTSIALKGDINQGVFLIQEVVVNGTNMQLVAQGQINFIDNKIKLTVLVAPFKTVDALVNKLPLMNYILKGSLISIPLKVTGDLKDPMIILLSPAAVSEEVFGIMKRTLFLPVKMIAPVIPGENKVEK